LKDLNAHIDHELAAKYLEGTCSKAEIDQFETWVKASSENKFEFDSLKMIWEADYSEPDQVDVEGAWSTVINEAGIEAKPIEREHSIFSYLSIAASVVLLIGVSAAFWFVNQQTNLVFKTSGEFANVMLNDGTTVSLSENTTLTYPEAFEGETREVSIIGKAFFQVAKNSDQPFIIHTDGGNVTVVGTAFEVNTMDANHALVVEVEEGIVDVVSSKTNEKARVTAGKVCKVSTNDEKMVVADFDNPAPFFWKDKTIKFKRTQLIQVAKTLKELMNLDIKLSSTEIEHCELTVVFTDEKPETMLEIIALTLSLDLSKEGTTYILSGEGC
jgi:transmembrane sensor